MSLRAASSIAQAHGRIGVRLNWTASYGMLAPTLLLLLMFMYFPAITALTMSFTNWDGFNPPAFNGVENYVNVLTDKVFWISMRNIGIWVILKTVIELCVPLVVATLIFHVKSEKLRYVYRVLFVIPMVVPGMVGLMIWQFIYSPNVGLLNTLLHNIGLGALASNWLGSPHIALASLIAIGFPFANPFNILIFYSGLQNIPESVFEASILDGIGPFRRFFVMEVPLVLGQIKLLMMLTVINLLQDITTPLVLTDGGPGYSTYVPGLYMYVQAFQNGEFGLGMSVATIIFLIVLGLTMIQVRFIRPETEFNA